MARKTKSNKESLKTYRAKRSADGTPEPFGSRGVSRPRLFVIQKHEARRLHYDFRLEWGGTLWSWAVPKGPSLNPKNKRLAVHVEDHPVEYADFEGKIPEGNYGAGTVIVWDKGLWVPIDDPDEGLEKGKMHFELQGYKLRGEWILVRTKGGSPKDWLLMKKADGYSVKTDEEPFGEESVFSGMTLEELRDGPKKASQVSTKLQKLGVPRKRLDALRTKLMLAKTAEEPFTSKDWVFELKYDGYRILAQKRDDEVLLRSRNGHDLTEVYPDVARVVGSLPYQEFVLDGELVVLDEEGRPDFQRLQKRSLLRRRRDVDRAMVTLPATFFAFDLLGFEGHDLRSLPLLKRKQLLREVLPTAGAIRYADHVPARGEAMYARIQEMGLEGIMAKKADSRYLGHRSPQWLKITVDRTGDFVVCGYTKPEGSRTGFGALHLGAYVGDRLVYAGRVGTGFNHAQLREYGAALSRMKVAKPPCEGRVPRAGKHVWVRPEWVVEVRYKTFTEEGLLRHPAFLCLREDKGPEECVRPGSNVDEPALEPLQEETVVDRSVPFTNLDKVFWPQEGYTKGDLIEYYRTVSPWLLPYLKDRPLVLTRYPDGIEGKSFYQKNVPDWIPEWVRTESVWSESSEKEIRYFVADDEETLLYIINSGAIPLHMWSSRVDSLARPDWCILDLDPKGASFDCVLTLARAIKKLCEEIELESFVKTTGSTGLHILLPLGGICTYEQSRMLGNLIARIIEAQHPHIATTRRNIAARKGRVYLDYLQNRHGQLLVAPFSIRPLPGAPASAPLEWREVNARLTPQKFTLGNLPPRLKRKKKDPMLSVLTAKPNLVEILARLAELT